MGFCLSLAFRNIWRHGKRSVITALAIAMGLGIFLLMDSMLQGADHMSEDNLVRHETGAIRIYSPGGAEERDLLSLKHPLEHVSVLQAGLASRGLESTRRMEFLGEIAPSDPGEVHPGSRYTRIIAMEPDEDGRVFDRRGGQLSGRWFAPGETGAVLGAWFAQDLLLSEGSWITLACRTRTGSFQVLDLQVTGILDSPDPVVNRNGVFIPLDLAQAELEMDDCATSLVIPPGTGMDVDARARELQAELDRSGTPVKVLTWKDLAADFLAISAAKKKGTSSILFLVFVIAAVGMGNTLLMAFHERKTEIGMMRALGMDNRSLFFTFLTEAAGIGLMGSIMGLVLGAGLVWWMVDVGIDFSFLTREMDIGYRISGTFRGLWLPASFLQALVLGVVLPVIVAILPTRRALRLPLTECLRTE